MDKKTDTSSKKHEDTIEINSGNGKNVRDKGKRRSPAKQYQEKIDGLEQEISQLKDQYLRLLAEFDNFRKRRQLESNETGNRVKMEILKSLLPVLDDTDRLFSSEDVNADSLISGAKMIADKFRKTLMDSGLKPMDSKGKQFDPEWHEALMMIESEDVKSGTIIDVFEPGYLFGDQVLRYAKVTVSK